MDRLQFAVPVRISPSAGQPVEEIYSVEQALDFLNEWPVGRQGPIYQMAYDACFGASVEIVSADDACKAFAAFCRVSGLLAKDVLVPEADESRIGQRFN
jgi:hypothetical protein